ncbi:MAG: ATP-binding cassette domain-containing protein [Cyclobacteriaceae bacterium]|nr:ATP-binding cassette domain-containing protein [Cyclobacteriaceae bacterium]
MKVHLKNACKRFSREWIFKNLDVTFDNSFTYAITGPNGSGKSTLLQVISGNMLLSEGSIQYKINDKAIEPDQIYKYTALTAPYLEIPEELTLTELLHFHFKFKKLKDTYRLQDLPELLQLHGSENKKIRDFSTGMRQRLKLGLSLFADAEIVLLDEPATNLDKSGVEWYLHRVQQLEKHQLLIICSNRIDEYEFCTKIIDMHSFK